VGQKKYASLNIAWDRGAGHFFGHYSKIKWRFLDQYANHSEIVSAHRLFLCPLCCANTIGATILTSLIGKARRIIKIHEFLFIGAVSAPL
jgi:hypothetical protein